MNFKSKILNYSILSVLIYLVVFVKIDTYHMRWWDESMFAVNTYEMLQNGNYFSMYFNGSPDISNSKPLLTVWIQLVFVKTLGYNEIALRLPSALAAAISTLLLFAFIEKRFGLTFAWLSTLVLITSNAFIGFHSARTADSDSILAFFLLVANVYFFKYLEEGKRSLILLFFVFIALSFCTKLYAALLFIPAYIAILIQQKKLKTFVFNFPFWKGFVIFSLSAIGIVYLREIGSPGYLREVFLKDAGRIFRVIEGHRHTWEFYLDNLINIRFSTWFLVMILGTIMCFVNRKDEKTKLIYYFLLLNISYLIIISYSITKLEWYDVPLFPYLSVITAYGIWKVFENRLDISVMNRTTILVLVVIFIYPYWLMFRKSQANIIPNGEKKLEANEKFLFKRSTGKSNLDGTKVYTSNWIGSLLFYKYKFAEKGEHISVTGTPDFVVRDKVLVSEDSLFEVIQSKYKFRILDQENNARLLQIENP